jgi:DNA polymerase
VLLYPLYHPAAALYTPRMLEVLEEDFSRIPKLISRVLLAPEPEPKPDHPELALAAPVAAEPAVQLGLF